MKIGTEFRVEYMMEDGDDLFDHYRHMLESLDNDFSRFVRPKQCQLFQTSLAVTIQPA